MLPPRQVPTFPCGDRTMAMLWRKQDFFNLATKLNELAMHTLVGLFKNKSNFQQHDKCVWKIMPDANIQVVQEIINIPQSQVMVTCPEQREQQRPNVHLQAHGARAFVTRASGSEEPAACSGHQDCGAQGVVAAALEWRKSDIGA